MGSKEEGLGLMKVGGMVGGSQAENPIEAMEGIPIHLEDSPTVMAGSHTETLRSQWGSLTTPAGNLTGRIQTDGVLVLLDLNPTMTVDPPGQATLLILCLVSGDFLPLVVIGPQCQVTQTKAEEGHCKDRVVLGTLHRDGEPRQGLQVILHQSFLVGPN